MARLVKMGVMEKQTEEEKNRSKFLNNAEVRKEYQFIQRSTPIPLHSLCYELR
jgi:hypothetical protein